MPAQEIFFAEKAGGREIVVIKTYDSHFAREAFDQMKEDAKAVLAQTLVEEGPLWKPTVETKTFGRPLKKAREKTGTLFPTSLSKKKETIPRNMSSFLRAGQQPNALRNVNWP